MCSLYLLSEKMEGEMCKELGEFEVDLRDDDLCDCTDWNGEGMPFGEEQTRGAGNGGPIYGHGDFS